MNVAIALSLLVALGLAIFAIRHFARRRGLRRQKDRRKRGGRPGPHSFVPLKTERSQMRTDDDPTTVIERITESNGPHTGPHTGPRTGPHNNSK